MHTPRSGFFLTVIMFLAGIGLLRAQQNIDSLKSVLVASSVQDTNRVKTLNFLAFALRSVDPKQGMNYAEQARELAAQLNYEKGRGDSYNAIGIIHYRRGEYVEAATSHLQALSIRERIGDKVGTAISDINLGNVYSDQNLNDLALEYYQNAVNTLTELNDKKRLATVYLNMGAIFLSQKKFSQGLNACLKAKAYAHETGNTDVEGQSLNNIGVAYEAQQRYEDALAAYTDAYAISKASGDNLLMVDNMINIGNMYRLRKQFNLALDWHHRSDTLARKIGYLEGLRVLYEDMSKDYQEMGQFETALNYHIRFKEVSDSLFNDENTSRMTEITNRWKNEHNEKVLLLQKQEIEQRKENEARATQRLWLIGASAFVLLIFAGYVLYAYSQVRQSRTLLSAQKEEIERKNEELGIKNKDITDSIIYSRRIQQALLPSSQRIGQLLKDSFVFYRPRDIVSGDFYWVESWGNEILVAAGDCTGHGVPGALLSVVGLNLLNQSLQVYGITKPAPILNSLNRGMAQALGQKSPGDDSLRVNDGMDIALIALDAKKRCVEFAGANNDLWVLRNGEVMEYRGDRQPVGQYSDEHARPFTSHSIELQPGDTLYLLTDGYTDQFGGPNGKKYKYARFKQYISSIAHLPMPQQKELIEREIDHWKGAHDQVDDMLVIGIRMS